MSNCQRETLESRPIVPPVAAEAQPASVMTPLQRRARRRYDVQLEVEFSSGERLHATTMRMVSLGGAFIESELRPAFNTRLQLSFKIPQRPLPVEVGCIVRWSDARGFGVQFDGLRAHAVWALGKFFDQQG